MELGPQRKAAAIGVTRWAGLALAVSASSRDPPPARVRPAPPPSCAPPSDCGAARRSRRPPRPSPQRAKARWEASRRGSIGASRCPSVLGRPASAARQPLGTPPRAIPALPQRCPCRPPAPRLRLDEQAEAPYLGAAPPVVPPSREHAPPRARTSPLPLASPPDLVRRAPFRTRSRCSANSSSPSRANSRSCLHRELRRRTPDADPNRPRPPARPFDH